MQSVDSPTLLIALPQLNDPNFVRSVVLLLEASDEGAMGLMINKPASHKVSELLVEMDLDIPPDVPSWYGGPVDAQRGLVLHNLSSDVTAANFGSQARVSSSRFAMERLAANARQDSSVQSPDVLYPFRFIIGYAGWGPGQLTEEMLAGSWIQVPFSAKLVFDTPWSKMWDEAMRSIGVEPYELVPSANPYLH
jgi:putative transcriptional regulator